MVSGDDVELGGAARAWLSEHWAPGVDRASFRQAVVDAGFAVPTWPVEWLGLGADEASARAIADAFHEVGAPGAGQDRHNLFAGTVHRHGSAALKHRLLRSLLTGELPMCLLYSEPAAGSDLASLRTRADRVASGWRITGQKVWTSEAHLAERGFLLARTNWDVPKHRGISFFIMPMRQPGIEIRGIRQITGETRFNEVFITEAFVASDDLLGEIDEGWSVLQTALGLERASMGADRTRPQVTPGRSRPDLDCRDLAQSMDRSRDPVLRQALADLYCRRRVHLWNGQRARATGAAALASLDKLSMSRLLHLAARVETAVLAADALVVGSDHAAGDAAAQHLLNAYFTSIGGGTDQIQQNLIGERVLGLPREPSVDGDVPFRAVATSASVHRPRRN